MSSNAISFLDGRTLPDASRPTTGRSVPGILQKVGHHLAARRHLKARRDHDRQDRTDGYLDRGGAASLDWGDGLAHHVGR